MIAETSPGAAASVDGPRPGHRSSLPSLSARTVSRVAGFTVGAALLVGAGSAQASTPPLLVGFSENLPEVIGSAATGPARDLGAGAMRITVPWSPGQTSLASADKTRLDRAVSAAGGLRLVLAVYADAGSSAPRDSTARTTYCTYVRNVLSRFTALRDVVIWNEPNKSLFWNPQTNAPGEYEALLARCWDVLHGAFPKVNVIGLPLSSTGNDNATSTSPGAFIRALGDAYRASGRTTRILDTVGFHPYPLAPSERPWRKHIQSKVIGMGDWNKLMYNLRLAFDGTAQPIPGSGGVLIWYLEAGFQTTVDPDHAAAYSGAENVAAIQVSAGGEPDSPPPAETSPAPDQATQIVDAIRLAACQPQVGAFFNFLLFDEPVLSGWQSGAYWADRTPKPSLDAFHSAIGEAASGGVDCATLKGGQPSGDFAPPGVPQNLRATAPSPPQVVLVWDPVVDSESAVSYRVYRNGAFVATTTDPEWTDANPPSGTNSYTVRAIDAAANLGDSSASVSTPVPDTQPPTQPTNLTANVRSGRVDLSWTASTDDVGVAGYEVSRDGAVLGTTTTSSFTDTGADQGDHTWSVVAYDAAGHRSDPATVQATVAAPPAGLAAPTNLSAAARSRPPRVQLSWAAGDARAVGYRVYRDGSVVATTTTTTYLDSKVKAAKKYRYAVTALDAGGAESPPSATVSVKTPKK